MLIIEMKDKSEKLHGQFLNFCLFDVVAGMNHLLNFGENLL